MKKSNNQPQKPGVAADKKKVTSNVARDDGVEPPKTATVAPIKPSIDPDQTKKA